MSVIWFSYNTSKSGDEQISMKETCGLCEGNAEQYSGLCGRSCMNSANNNHVS